MIAHAESCCETRENAGNTFVLSLVENYSRIDKVPKFRIVP